MWAYYAFRLIHQDKEVKLRFMDVIENDYVFFAIGVHMLSIMYVTRHCWYSIIRPIARMFVITAMR